VERGSQRRAAVKGARREGRGEASLDGEHRCEIIHARKEKASFLALAPTKKSEFPKKMEWTAFVNRLDAGDKRPTLAEVGAVLRSFLLPCISRKSQESGVSWNPTHHWR
jgi:hypothetical protein